MTVMHRLNCDTVSTEKVAVNNRREEMAEQKPKMICSKCGGEMNHHADKVIYPGSPGDAIDTSVAWGGVIEETHACPGCGAVESRRADG